MRACGWCSPTRCGSCPPPPRGRGTGSVRPRRSGGDLARRRRARVRVLRAWLVGGRGVVGDAAPVGACSCLGWSPRGAAHARLRTHGVFVKWRVTWIMRLKHDWNIVRNRKPTERSIERTSCILRALLAHAFVACRARRAAHCRARHPPRRSGAVPAAACRHSPASTLGRARAASPRHRRLRLAARWLPERGGSAAHIGGRPSGAWPGSSTHSDDAGAARTHVRLHRATPA